MARQSSHGGVETDRRMLSRRDNVSGGVDELGKRRREADSLPGRLGKPRRWCWYQLRSGVRKKAAWGDGGG